MLLIQDIYFDGRQQASSRPTTRVELSRAPPSFLRCVLKGHSPHAKLRGHSDQVTPHLRSGRRRRCAWAHSSFFICQDKMKYLCAAALAASLATAQAGGAVELSEDNFNAQITGKNGFIKFLAPVSPHLFCVGSRARA